MTDWMNDGFAVQAGAPDEMVHPPRILFACTSFVVLMSLVHLLPSLNHQMGYVVSLVGASLGGVVAVLDQKKRADTNYISFGWFSPGLRIVRFLSLAAAVGNIAYLAIDAWHGKGII